jgi:hypothetical protein
LAIHHTLTGVLWHIGATATHYSVAAGQESAVPTISTAISRSHAGRWLAFTVLLAGGLLPSVDFFIVNVSLPSIHVSLGASPAEAQLVVSGYAAGYAVFLITGGRLGDLYGRRRLFLIGMAGFIATNTLCGLAATRWSSLLAGSYRGSQPQCWHRKCWARSARCSRPTASLPERSASMA